MDRCARCEGLLTTLFYSISCAHCENPPSGQFWLGVVNRYMDDDFFGATHLLYADFKSAKKDIRPMETSIMVLSPAKIYWAEGYASSFFYKIYQDHRFNFGTPEDCAFLVSDALKVKKSGGFESNSHWVIL